MTQMTELEERLATPDGEALRTQLQDRLAQTALRLKGRLAQPLPCDDYAAHSSCLQAVDAAQAVLGRWRVGTELVTPSTGSGVARR